MQITVDASQLVQAKSAMELLMAENKDLTAKVAAVSTLGADAAERAANAAINLGEIRPVEKAAAVEAFKQDPGAIIDLLEKASMNKEAGSSMGGPATPDTRGKSNLSAHDPSIYGKQADRVWEEEFSS